MSIKPFVNWINSLILSTKTFAYKHKFLTFLSIVGLISIIRKREYIYRFFKMYTVVLRKKNLLNEYGPGWAIVTDCTSGYGWDYCLDLARNHFDIIMISNDSNELEKKYHELKSIYPLPEVKLLALNMFDSNQLNIQMEQLIKDLNVSILINNFENLKSQDLQIVSPEELNILLEKTMNNFLTLTQLSIKEMLKRKKKSAILTVFIEDPKEEEEKDEKGKFKLIKGPIQAFQKALLKSLATYYNNKIDFLFLNLKNSALRRDILTQNYKNYVSEFHFSLLGLGTNEDFQIVLNALLKFRYWLYNK